MIEPFWGCNSEIIVIIRKQMQYSPFKTISSRDRQRHSLHESPLLHLENQYNDSRMSDSKDNPSGNSVRTKKIEHHEMVRKKVEQSFRTGNTETLNCTEILKFNSDIFKSNVYIYQSGRCDILRCFLSDIDCLFWLVELR